MYLLFSFFYVLLIPFLFKPSFAKEIIDLSHYEFQKYSQNGEDGVIEAIFESIGTTSRYYVEFGAESGIECNTRYLRENGWNGLLMDGQHHNPEIGLHKEFITAENINQLLERYHVPTEFDLLSIDIDYNDFYVWHEISKKYKPRVVVIEYNGTHFPDEDKIVRYNPQGFWDGSNYFGASILALFRLGQFHGYSLVYADSKGVNLFFIRNDLISFVEKKGCLFKNINDVKALYQAPKYSHGPNGGHHQDLQNRSYTSFQKVLCSPYENDLVIKR